MGACLGREEGRRDFTVAALGLGHALWVVGTPHWPPLRCPPPCLASEVSSQMSEFTVPIPIPRHPAPALTQPLLGAQGLFWGCVPSPAPILT